MSPSLDGNRAMYNMICHNRTTLTKTSQYFFREKYELLVIVMPGLKWFLQVFLNNCFINVLVAETYPSMMYTYEQSHE